ncbi:MAG: hypothetical protein DMG21_16710 [Acidobacteria bacterium]|nr:MAG: hypothetical protein DMG21_16710 [Acidobacteriota bacterium]
MARPRNSSALDFREYLTTITEELKARIEQQRLATLALLNERGGESPSIAYCPLVDCRPNQRLREAIRQAVEVLDDTRRSFKSRQLEELRRRLEAALVEHGE